MGFLLLLTNNTAQAQNDKFNKFVANFKETSVNTGIESTSVALKAIDQQLAWEFTWQKNQFQKPEKCFVVPFGYYKITPKTALIISAVTDEIAEKSTYTLVVQTYNIKKGKVISEEGGILGTFSDYLKLSSKVAVDAKGNITITSKGGFGKDIVENFTINSSGKINRL